VPSTTLREIPLDLLYLSTSCLWWQVVAAILGVTSSNTLRNHSRCTRRHRQGARNVYHTAIRRACSSWCPCRSSTSDVHGCPRGVAPLRYHITIRDTPVAHMGGATPPLLQMPRDARPACLSSFCLLAMASPHLDARRNLWI